MKNQYLISLSIITIKTNMIMKIKMVRLLTFYL